MKKTAQFFFVVTLVLIVPNNSENQVFCNKTVTRSIYLQKVRELAETMEVFPIDFIARYGPLSRWGEDDIFYHRVELSQESFRLFYNFCQLALDATSEDIDTCLNYFDMLAPREQALIMTIMYIYFYPWERQKTIESLLDLEGSTWFSIQFVTFAFDLAARKARDNSKVCRKACFTKIREYVNDDRIAFSITELTENDMRRNNEDFIRCRKKLVDICKSINWVDIDILPHEYNSFESPRNRMILLQKIRERFPTTSQIVITDILYALYNRDTRPPYMHFVPTLVDANVEPKTVGQIAQQLLESWSNDNDTTIP